MSCGVNGSSLFKWLLLQNCVKINRTTFFPLKLFPVISGGPQKYKYENVPKKKDFTPLCKRILPFMGKVA